jgi:putative flavoprotein involved in K+ transport
MERTDVAIIGGGQAGLALSVCLARAGIDHLVIERGRIGERWLNERRAGLRLLTPAWMTRLPGFAPPRVHPDSFLPTVEFADLLDRQAEAHALPLRLGTAVEAVERWGDFFVLTTSRNPLLARTVVIATGACDHLSVPLWAAALSPSIAQVTSDRFDAASVPPGGVLVVGASRRARRSPPNWRPRAAP